MYLVYTALIFLSCVTILTSMVTCRTTVLILKGADITKEMIAMELVFYMCQFY